ncbi:MAG: hypothetical protein LBT22_05955, partial [Peptococcaceae bacterium]|nr:hypothetical protein [Peptococcaceae bacterium]
MYSLSKLPRLTGSVLLGTVLAGGVFGYAVLGWVAVQKVIVQQNAQPHQERIEMAQGQAQETESGQGLELRLEPEPEKAQEEQEPETRVTEPVAEITAAAIAPLAAPEVEPESVQPVTPEWEPAVQELPLVAQDTEAEPVVLASEPEPEPPVQEAQPVSRGNRSHAEIAELALTLVGIPYVAGGSSRNG